MSFGENYGDSTLLRSLCDAAEYVKENYENGNLDEACIWAKSLMEGSMEMWSRLVEEKAELDG